MCLTFDDGYKGVYTHAFPVFRRLAAPFAVFVATDLVDRQMPLWWDALERLISAVEHVDSCKQRLPTRTPRQKRIAIATLACDLRWRSPAVREARLAAMADINAGLDLHAAYERSLTWPMLQEMAASGLATFGAHTASHALLATLPPPAIAAEFATSRERIVAKLGLPVPFLAYPFGQPDEVGPHAASAARASGFEHAFTTIARPLTSADLARPHDLPRVLLSAKAQSSAIVRAYMSGAPAALTALRNG